MGTELKEAIEKMRLNPSQFAKLCKRPDGSHLSPPTIKNLIVNPNVEPERETVELVEKVLAKACPHCGQYWSDAPTKKR